MHTPICDFVRRYAQEKPLRLHMPGHKGVAFSGAEPLDITEIDGADVLYHAEGIIRRSEENAARLFGTARTVYSAEGSSLAIRAMLCLALLDARERGRTPLILAGRNAHKTFLTACALLDLPIRWIRGEELLTCRITAESLKAELSTLPEPPAALYLTTPDYLGNLIDLAPIARLCRERGIRLLVDNAHGAYLNFLPKSRHPIALGADACCDSAHKTLPVLTGGAYLHLSPHAPTAFIEQADRAMSLFASTSPSYLILQSLDRANAYLADGYRERLAELCDRLAVLREHLKERGYRLTGDEPLKVTLLPKPFGYTGQTLSDILREQGIFCEFADPDHLVMMFTPELTQNELHRVQTALLSVQRKAPITEKPPTFPEPTAVLTPRQALFAPSERLPTERCEGRILADPQISCPPAVPIVACGERIDAAAQSTLTYYGITHCRVLKEPSEPFSRPCTDE